MVHWKSKINITLNGTSRGTYDVDGSGSTFANGIHSYLNNESGAYIIEFATAGQYDMGPGISFAGITPSPTQNLIPGGDITFTLNFTGGSTSMSDSSRSLASVASAVQGLGSASEIGQSVNTIGTESLKYTWNNDLQIGSSLVADVSALQKVLVREGVYSGDVTGGFYDQTYIAVKKFQKKYDIKETGYVGYLTRQKLNALYAR